jgi:hypothetical protein
MVEIKVTRDFRIEGDNIIAIKKSEWVNGLGKNMVQTEEEHNITPQEVEDVLNVYVNKELDKVKEDEDKLLAQIQETKDSIKDVVGSEDYLKFKENIRTEQSKIFFNALNKEAAIRTGEAQLKEVEIGRADIQNYKEQFEKIKQALSK